MDRFKQNTGTLLPLCTNEICLDFAYTGEEVYTWWLQVSDAAVDKAEECKEIYQSFSDKVIELEDEKNACYQEEDGLKKEYDNIQAKMTGIVTHMSLLQNDMANVEAEIVRLEYRIKELESDKKIYDALIWVPIVNIVSEIVAAIDGTRDELSGKKRTLTEKTTAIGKLTQEKEDLENIKQGLKQQIQDNKDRQKMLEKQIETYMEQRKEAAQEMIAWADRKNRYLELAGQMKHLIAMGADISEFRSLLETNISQFKPIGEKG